MSKLKIFTAWGTKGTPNTLVDGEGRPKFANGTLMPNCDELIFTIQAATWEEAMAIYNIRLGHDPYRPIGKPEKCPKCGAVFYPKGSGECWRCGKVE